MSNRLSLLIEGMHKYKIENKKVGLYFSKI